MRSFFIDKKYKDISSCCRILRCWNMPSSFNFWCIWEYWIPIVFPYWWCGWSIDSITIRGLSWLLWISFWLIRYFCNVINHVEDLGCYQFGMCDVLWVLGTGRSLKCILLSKFHTFPNSLIQFVNMHFLASFDIRLNKEYNLPCNIIITSSDLSIPFCITY